MFEKCKIKCAYLKEWNNYVFLSKWVNTFLAIFKKDTTNSIIFK